MASGTGKMWWKWLVGILIVGVLIGTLRYFAKDTRSPGHASVPIQEIEWLGEGGGFIEWGKAKDGFFGISVRPKILEIWRWEGATFKKELREELHRVSGVTVIQGNRYLGSARPGSYNAPWPLVLRSPGSQEVIKKWAPPPGWWYAHQGISRNGKFAALTLGEEGFELSPPDSNPEGLQLRVGLFDTTTEELHWVAGLAGRDGAWVTVRRIAVSDDGKYIAVGGWDNGVALVDVSLRKVLWAGRPPEIGSLGYVVFSSDGSKLYAGGTLGYVGALETKTGKITGRWCATETGEPIYGHRISCMAISPDDSWIAAGTGPEGEVYLFDVTIPGSRPVILPHGLTTMMLVSFSPDSRYLASATPGRIKIWRVARQTSTAPATSNAEALKSQIRPATAGRRGGKIQKKKNHPTTAPTQPAKGS